MDLLEKIRGVFQSGTNQAQQSLRGLGNRVVNNAQWAGQQAQRNIPATTAFIKELYKGPQTFGKGFAETLRTSAPSVFGPSNLSLQQSYAKTLQDVGQKNIQKGYQVSNRNLVNSGQKLLNTGAQEYKSAAQGAKQSAINVGLGGVQSAMPVFGAQYALKNPAIVGLGGALSGAINKVQGGSFREGFGQGAASMVRDSALYQATNPLIAGVTGAAKTMKILKTPVQKYIAGSILSGIGNMGEDEIVSNLLQNPRGATDRVLSFGLGAVASVGGGKIENWNALKKSTRKAIIDSADKAGYLTKSARDVWHGAPDVPAFLYDAWHQMRKLGWDGTSNINKQAGFIDLNAEIFPKMKGDVEVKQGKIPTKPPADPLLSEARKYKTTVNIQDKNDLDYLRRIFSEDTINDIKAGKKENWRGQSYEDIAKINIISETPKTIEQQLAGKPKFSPTTMTRQEKVAKDMLKRGDITGQQYNDIAMKNEGVKPIGMEKASAELNTPQESIPVKELQKQGQQIKILKDIAKYDKQIAKIEAELRAGVGSDVGLNTQDKTKLGQLKSMFQRADQNEGAWDVESLKKNNKTLVNWATERWRELYPQKSSMTDDELINDIYDFVSNNQLSGKAKPATPDSVKILKQAQQDQDAIARITGYSEDQFHVRKGKPMTMADSEREQKMIEQSLSQRGARDATVDELEMILNTPDSQLKGGYTFEKGQKPTKNVIGKNDDPQTFRQIINRFLGGKENTKISQYEQIKPISNVKFTDEGAKEAIRAIETGNTSSLAPEAQKYVGNLRQSFDKVRSEAVADGLPIGYVDNYLTHYWQQDPATVQAVINRLRTSGAFQKERTFLTYDEGISAGLTPRFQNPTQILGNYVRQVESVRNNLKLIKALEANGYVVSGKARELAQGVREIAIPGFEGRFAQPEVARVIEGLFEPREANKIIGTLGKISGMIQDVTLSGGVPGTPFNAFSIAGNLQKQFLAGRYSGPLKSFARAFSPKETTKYFQENIPTIREIQDGGYSLPTNLSYSKLMGDDTTTAGKVWNAAVSDPTFKRFIPMMQIDLYKEVKDRALRAGLSNDMAKDKALAVLKNFEGMSDMYSRATQDPNVRAGTQTIFFAPKFRQAIMGIWTSSLKALKNPLALENQYNIRFLVGSVLAFAGMNVANAYFNNGKMMWENGRNKEDKLIIPDGKGGQIGIPFLSSLGTIPRGAARQAIKILKGDMSGAASDAGQTYLSSLIKPLADITANQDYFGKTIVQPDSKSKWGDIMGYLGRSYVSHPYLKELLDPRNTSDPAYQKLSRAMELPLRFYDKKSVDGARYYEARDKALESLSESERKAYDAIPKYDANDLNTQMYKYQTFLTYPNVFEAKRMTEFELAKQTGKAIDPLYLVNFDTAKRYMRYSTLPPGSQDRKDMVKAFPELEALFDVRSRYFTENPIEGQQTSNKPIPSAYVQQQMDAKNWSDPQVRAYLDANTMWQNEQRAKLGLAPLAGFTPYAKKPKKVSVKLTKVKAPKIKAFKVKLPKLKKMKQPKIKLLKNKPNTITMKGIKLT